GRSGGPRGPGGPGGRPGGPGGRGGARSGGDRRRRDDDKPVVPWEPKTRLGKMVKSGQCKTMSEALATKLPLREPEIVDALLPELADEVININMVQRMTDSGRRVRFSITAVTGNRDGFVGIGMAKGKEVGPTIKRAIDRAKISMIEVKRGSGSWQSGVGAPANSVPFKLFGKCASTEVTIKPAPQGTGLVGGKTARAVLGLAGVHDAWIYTRGQTGTSTNYAKALFNALKAVDDVQMTPAQRARIQIVPGPQRAPALRPVEQPPADAPTPPQHEVKA
ncbi:MAG TPA: 30S ribosomal protein S5, partial [Candidatus Thermoplasmatota archaeon]|nr:30S ribosomal protein S5 [Candidatus Thermoplasmatota archaeon]